MLDSSSGRFPPPPRWLPVQLAAIVGVVLPLLAWSFFTTQVGPLTPQGHGGNGGVTHFLTFQGVGCSATNCGLLLSNDSFATEAETLTPPSANWASVPGGLPANTYTGSTPAGISCPTTTMCASAGALGDAATGNEVLSVFEEGSSGWTTSGTLALSSTTTAQPMAISCPTPTVCFAAWAVFKGLSSSATWMLARDNNGVLTSLLMTASHALGTPLNVDSHQPSSLSCPTTTSCLLLWGNLPAPGSSAAELSAAAVWNGATWSYSTFPTQVALSAGNCTAASSCWAAGTSTDTSQGLYVVHWNGNAWTVVNGVSLSLTNVPASVGGIACPVTTTCYVIGAVASSPEAINTTEAFALNLTTLTATDTGTIVGANPTVVGAAMTTSAHPDIVLIYQSAPFTDSMSALSGPLAQWTSSNLVSFS